VRQAKTAPDQPAVAEQRLDFFRMGIGRDVEILRMQAEERVADAAAHQECLEPGVVQPVQDFQGVLRYFGPGDVMGRAGDDCWFDGVLDPAVFQIDSTWIMIMRPYNSSLRPTGADSRRPSSAPFV
jgi:hypothetical protein